MIRSPAIAVLCLCFLTSILSGCEYSDQCAGDAFEQIGKLDPQALPEASGLAISARYPGRLYHINDSGAPSVVLTDTWGKGTRAVSISGVTVRDPEALSLGPCPEAGTCLFVGDIGDNYRARSEVEIWVLAEPEEDELELPALRRLRLRYPDGAHDAEAMAVHPNGDIYILTKELHEGRARPARLFRLGAAEWSERTRDEVLELWPVATLDLPELLPTVGPHGPYSKLATAMDISSDGRRVLILTYSFAMELEIDLGLPDSTGRLARLRKDDGQHRVLTLQPVIQAEAVAYQPDSRAFLYTSEKRLVRGVIVQYSCRSAVY